MTKATTNNIEHTERLSDCAQHHPKKVASLSEKKLAQEYELPCGCEGTSLKNLLENYECSECDEECYYCFCMGDVMDTSMWYCDACGTCREDSEWHCPRCNDCTYGLTLKCDGCGKKSPYMP